MSVVGFGALPVPSVPGMESVIVSMVGNNNYYARYASPKYSSTGRKITYEYFYVEILPVNGVTIRSVD